jgi:putative hydrolase of the HAD superfamily
VAYRAVFFDAGETLVHAHPSFPELLGAILQREGYEVDQDLLRRKIHLVGDRFAQAARERTLWTTSPERSRAFWATVYRAFLAELGIPFGDGLGEILYAEFTDLSNYRLFDDVEPVLRRLHEDGLILGVVSNFEEWLERLLEQLGVTRFFDVRVISGIEGMEKPDPGIFLLALERAGVEPGSALYVGDNPYFDVDPPSSIGMPAVLIDRRGRYPEFDGPRITTMADLPGVVGLEG